MKEKLSQYTEQPDEGLFDRIQRRLVRRRMWRWSAAAAAAVLVAGAILWTVVDRTAGTPTSVAPHAPAGPEMATIEPARTESQAEMSSQPASSPLVKSQTKILTELPPPQPMQQMVGQTTAPSLPAATASAPEYFAVSDLLPSEQEPVAPDADPLPMAATSPASSQTAYLWAPNAIVPSDADERNRVFRVHSSGPLTAFRLYIYNRAGRQVFSTDDIERGWDATLHGQPLPGGAYVWVATFRDAQNQPHTERGSIAVLR